MQTNIEQVNETVKSMQSQISALLSNVSLLQKEVEKAILNSKQLELPLAKVEPEAVQPVKKYTIDDVRDSTIAATKRCDDHDKIQRIINDFGASRISEISKEDYEQVIDLLEAA